MCAGGQDRTGGAAAVNGCKVGRAAAIGVGTILGVAATRTGTDGFADAQVGKPEGMTVRLVGGEGAGVASQAGGTVGAVSKSAVGFGAVAETVTIWLVGGTTRGRANAPLSGPTGVAVVKLETMIWGA